MNCTKAWNYPLTSIAVALAIVSILVVLVLRAMTLDDPGSRVVGGFILAVGLPFLGRLSDSPSSAMPSALGLLVLLLFLVSGCGGAHLQQPQAPSSPGSSAGTTWYVRLDGGTSTQCTGTTNAAYSGNGTRQGCAFNHPYWLLDQSTFAWKIAGGDTVRFEDTGPYLLGQYNSTTGRGVSWPFCVGRQTSLCRFPPLPNGTSDNPTQLLGVGAGNCHTTDPSMQGPNVLRTQWAGHGALQNATKLVGINHIFKVIDLQGSQWVDVECFDISQATTCTSGGTGVGRCSTNKGAGNGADDDAQHGIFLEYQTGQGPANATLRDIAIHGLSSEGISGGHLNRASSDTFTASDIYLLGNGSAGWDWDGGGCAHSCESVGTMNISWLRIEWNGCVEITPNGGSIGGKGYNYCYDDSHGGYGDGWALIATQGTWTVDHGLFRWNTQDGFDSLHTSDDLANPPTSITLSNSWSEGNEGQTFKVGSASNVLVYNNISISDCRRLSAPFAPNPTGFNAGLSDFCRAAGDEWAFALNNGMGPLILEHNTTLGYGATMYDIECAGHGTCTTGTQITFRDNLSIGFPDPGNGKQLPGGIYDAAHVFSQGAATADHNLWFQIRSGCPQKLLQETNYVCLDPLLSGESDITAIDPTLTSSSPARAAGAAITGQQNDFAGYPWPPSPSIGALEYQVH